MTWAKPAAEVTRLANRHTSQMRTYAHHDEPFWFLDAVLVSLGVAQFGYIDIFGFFDLVWSAVADEDGLAAPFDKDL